MLTSLTIQNFVIVEELELTLHAGMTVLSGETGAGKSILIDALSLCLGARSEANHVRHGCARAQLSACFDKPPASTLALLAEHSLGPDPDSDQNSLILRRVIEANGRSKGFVNGTPVPLGILKTLGETLVDIHGQHAFQTLAKPSEQLHLLDHYGKLHAETATVKQAYTAYQQAQKALQQAQEQEANQQSQLETLRWKLDTLEQLAPQADEWQALSQEHSRLHHGAALQDGVQHALNTLQEDPSLLQQLGRMVQSLEALAQRDPALGPSIAQLREAEIVLREASHELGHYHRQLNLDPQRLAAVEQRLGLWHDTARKLKTLPEALHSTWQSLQQSLNTLQQAADLNALQQAVDHAQQHYTQHAQALSTKRHAAAKILGQVVTDTMQQLNMRGGVFEVALQAAAPSAHGSDGIEFRAAGHPGVPPQAIGKVASGGELARLSLAITVNTVQGSTLPTLLFDEVDSGIGGAVAETVGHYLRQLASNKQVLCVTHLPQVAACGHQHLRVFKHIENEQTRSGIVPIEGQARVEELARMLGGKTIGPATLSAAKELLEHGGG